MVYISKDRERMYKFSNINAVRKEDSGMQRQEEACLKPGQAEGIVKGWPGQEQHAL